VYKNSQNVAARVKQKYAKRRDGDRQYRQYREKKRTCKCHNFDYYFKVRKKEEKTYLLDGSQVLFHLQDPPTACTTVDLALIGWSVIIGLM